MVCSIVRRPNPKRALTSLRLLVALLALAGFAPRPAEANDPTPANYRTTVAVLKRVEAKSRAVAAHVLGATVGIINQSLAGNGRQGEGSGVVVSEDGLILTAGHVLAKPGSDLTVIFPDGRRAAAKALGATSRAIPASPKSRRPASGPTWKWAIPTTSNQARGAWPWAIPAAFSRAARRPSAWDASSILAGAPDS